MARGRETDVFIKGSADKLRELPRLQADRLGTGLKELDPENLSYFLDRKRIVVDCLLGTGFVPPLKEDIKEILEIINKKSKIILSCDIPTGVNGDTGAADESSVKADVTVTFGYPKIGHAVSPGSEYTGSLEVKDIGIDLSPDKYLEGTEFIVRQDCLEYFSRRERASHKKDYGHVLVVGGSPGMEGAPAMAALGALRTGAGLVTCAVTGTAANAVTAHAVGAMKLIMDADERGRMSYGNLGRIMDFIQERKIDSVVLGPGMGTGDGQKKLVAGLLERAQCPVVLDADGINCIKDSIQTVKDRGYPLVMTPHPGEMARITEEAVGVTLDKRGGIVTKISKMLGCLIVLKGYRTLVTDGSGIYINATGNPGMATGGSGDILSGIIASLAGQGMSLIDSARTGVWVHGRAGDAAGWISGEKFIQPQDIIEAIKRI